MRRMLFICTGNVCRSPFAERYAANLVANPEDWQFVSAGTAALAGSQMEPSMAQELHSRGGSDDGFVARQLDRTIIESADLIIAMEVYHRQVVLDDFPALVRRTYTLGQLRRLVEESAGAEQGAQLLESIGQFRRRARDEDDIADPYRRGSRAAASSAGQIAGHLDAVLARLTA